MNIHKNARLTYARRLEMVRSIVEQETSQVHAAALNGVSVPTVRKWLVRYLAQGEAGLVDRRSPPKHSPPKHWRGKGAFDCGIAPQTAHPSAHRR